MRATSALDGNPTQWLEVICAGRESRGGQLPVSYDAEYWRQRADDARVAAETMVTRAAKREMLAIAIAYERLAEHAEHTASRKRKRERSAKSQDP